MKKDIIACIILIAVSVITVKDLFKPGFYTSHDGPNQVVRMYYFDEAIRDLQIPPRWSNGLLNGFGYPIFNFSYHMPWYIAESFRALNFSIIDSIKASFLFGYVLSGVAMYLFLRTLYPRFASFVGAWVYLFAPYRFVNIFVRAAIGDATAFAFAPLLFLSFVAANIKTKNTSRYIALGGLSFAALVLSHAMIFLFFSIAFTLYAVYTLVLSKRIDIIRNFLLIIILGMGISAYYFFPSLIEKNITKFAFTFSSVFNGALTVELKQLLYSPWGYGLANPDGTGMSLQVGIAQWFVVGLAILWVIGSLMFRRKIFVQEKKDIIFFLVIFFISILSMLEFASPFWRTFGTILTIDFSWRILSLTVFSVAVVSAGLIASIKFPKIVGVIIIILALYANRNHLRINESLYWDVRYYRTLTDTTNMFDEYLPKWIDPETVEKRKPKVAFWVGSGTYKDLDVRSNSITAVFESSQAAKIRVNTIYYPGWKAYVNGKETPIDRSLGFLDVEIPKGQSTVEVRLTDTPLRTMSNLVTIVSLGITAFLVIKNPAIPNMPTKKYDIIQKRKKKK